MELTEHAVPCRDEGTEASRVAGELVLLDAGGRTLRGLNETAARAWELIDGQRTAGEIASALAREFQAPLARVRQDILTFFGQLQQRGLLKLLEGGAR